MYNISFLCSLKSDNMGGFGLSLFVWQPTRLSVQREFSARQWRSTAQCHNSSEWCQTGTSATHSHATGAAGRWTSKKGVFLTFYSSSVTIDIYDCYILINSLQRKNKFVKFYKISILSFFFWYFFFLENLINFFI